MMILWLRARMWLAHRLLDLAEIADPVCWSCARAVLQAAQVLVPETEMYRR